MAKREEAEEALFDAIISNAEEAKSAEKGTAAGAIKTLAEAYAQIVHGPQGGDWDSRVRNQNTQETDYRYTAQSDIHETRHEGEDRERPPAGFRERR